MMDTSLLSSILQHYHWQLSLYALLGVIAISVAGRLLLPLIPALGKTRDLNREAAMERVKRSYYPGIQRRSKFWGLLTQLGVFVLILPFVLTLESQPWWRVLLDVFIILMFYDFFYYLVHRFVFHNNGVLGGPLVWVHAVHHQQKNPCRMDSNYLNPIETCIGIALYGASIGVLGLLMGGFHVATIVISMVAFSEINQHNHDLMEEDRFPFKYLNYMSYMHHVHHAKFTGGNYATISLFYDWLFGTLDKGDGYGKFKEEKAGDDAGVKNG